MKKNLLRKLNSQPNPNTTAQKLGTPHPLEIQKNPHFGATTISATQACSTNLSHFILVFQQVFNVQLVNTERELQTKVARRPLYPTFAGHPLQHPHNSRCPVFQNPPPANSISSLTGFSSAAYPSNIP